MPGSFVAAIVFAIIAAIVFFVGRVFFRAGNPPPQPGEDATSRQVAARNQWELRAAAAATVRKWLTIAAAVVAALAVIFLISSMYNPVGTRKEGIELTFGKPHGHLQNGFHLTAPWVKVATMDAAIQTDVYARESNVKQGASASGPCIDVRMAFQQLGCVDISLRWRIQQNSADELYRDYRSFEHVRGSLVTREFRAAVNEAFANYNPLNSVAGVVSSSEKNPTLGQLSQKIAELLRGQIGNRIDVLNVIVVLIHYDGETQKRIDQLQQQVAETRIAEQARITNEKQAAANAALSKSVNTSPNVLVAQCMNTLQAMVKNGQTVPAGFSCWPGGSGTAIIANSGK